MSTSLISAVAAPNKSEDAQTCTMLIDGPPGIGSGESSITPAASSSSNDVASVPAAPSTENAPAPQAEAPAVTIVIERRGWLGTYIEKVSLDTALQKKWITPKEAMEKDYCNQAYLTARGFHIVTFVFQNWIGAREVYTGKLRSALRDGFITIEEAIEKKFITREQAIEGGFLEAGK